MVLVLPLLSCGNSADNEMLATAATPGTQLIGRFVTPELWAGQATATNTRSPATGGGPVVLGPIEMRHPIDGHLILAYERVVHLESGRKRQLLTVTQDGAGLGRVLDSRAGQPERRFAGDVVFPLGVWRQGEMREFKATEHTLLGPALRQITLEIMDVDHIHNGVANSLRYRLTIRDEARRVLDCEVSVYSPGLGLVAFEASSYWQGCNTCPCPG